MPAIKSLMVLRDFLRDERIPVEAGFDEMKETIAAAKRAIGTRPWSTSPPSTSPRRGLDLQAPIEEAEAEKAAAA